MRKLGAFLCLCLLACGPKAATTPSAATPKAPVEPGPPSQEPEGIDAAKFEADLDAYIASFGTQWGEAYRFSGFVLVTQRGEPVYAKGFGLADRDARATPNADTTFRVGSVTKQFTAAAILKLQEQGKLSVKDTVRQHLPDYPATGDEITLHHLLTHTAGVWSYTSDVDWMDNAGGKAHTTAQMLALFKDRPLEFEPGEKFSYSNSGYVLLGAIVEAVSGTTYPEYVHKELFAVAGLSRTTYGDVESLGNVAKGYSTGLDEKLEPAKPIDMSTPHAAGAIRSTANDLAKWHAALSGDTVLSAKSKEQLYRSEKAGYAYGWMVSKADGRTRISHGGGIHGFATFYARLVEDDIVVVAWTNHEAFAVHQVGEAAVRFAVGEPVAPHEETPLVELDPAVAKRITGGYVITEEGRQRLLAAGMPAAAVDTMAALDIHEQDGFVVFDAIGQPNIRAHATGPTKLLVKSPRFDIDISFGEGDKAAAQALTVSQGPLSIEYKRNDRGAKKARKAFKKATRTKRAAP